jgi:single-strand DNA-binding protein
MEVLSKRFREFPVADFLAAEGGRISVARYKTTQSIFLIFLFFYLFYLKKIYFLGGTMSNLNRIFLMGNLTKDTELRYSPSNIAVMTFSLAVNSVVGKDADGNRKTEVLFIDVVAFGKQAETINQYCKKGSPLFVEGRLRLRTWEDKDKNKHSKYEVVLSGFQLIGSANGPKEEDIPPEEGDDVPF